MDQIRTGIDRRRRVILLREAGDGTWRAVTAGMTAAGLPELLLRDAPSRQVALDLIGEASGQLLARAAFVDGLLALDQGDACDAGAACGHGWTDGCSAPFLVRLAAVPVRDQVFAQIAHALYPGDVRLLELRPASLN